MDGDRGHRTAGHKGKHDPDRTHNRHGTEPTTVTPGGRRIPTVRPRVRTVATATDPEREVGLTSHATFADTDLLASTDVDASGGVAARNGRPLPECQDPALRSDLSEIAPRSSTAIGTSSSRARRRVSVSVRSFMPRSLVVGHS
jgi:hypothetical protein